MTRVASNLLSAICSRKPAILFLLTILCSGALAAETSFYRNEHALFSLRPAADKPVTNLTRVGPIGISLDLLQPAFTMHIKGIEPGSPAATSGQLKPGMIIESINGEKMAGIDPRIQLGNWITQAEATNGRVVMMVADEPGGEAREVVVQLPVLGRYSDTWPLKCRKSDTIVQQTAEFIAYLRRRGFEIAEGVPA